MPLEYRIYPDKRLVYAIGVDRVTLDDLIEHLDALAADVQYEAPMKKLIDYRHCEPLRLTMDESHRFTKAKTALSNRFVGERCAIIVTADSDFGMSRVHGARSASAGFSTNVFRDVESALAWLDIELIEDEMES